MVLSLLAVLLFGLRRSFGVISVILAGGAVCGIARYTPVHVQVASSYATASGGSPH